MTVYVLHAVGRVNQTMKLYGAILEKRARVVIVNWRSSDIWWGLAIQRN